MRLFPIFPLKKAGNTGSVKKITVVVIPVPDAKKGVFSPVISMI